MPRANYKPDSNQTAKVLPILPKFTTPTILKAPTKSNGPKIVSSQVPHTDHVEISPSAMQQQPYPTAIVQNQAVVNNAAWVPINNTIQVPVISAAQIPIPRVPIPRVQIPRVPIPRSVENQLKPVAPRTCTSTVNSCLKSSFDSGGVCTSNIGAQVENVGVHINKSGEQINQNKSSECESNSLVLNIKTEKADGYFDRIENSVPDVGNFLDYTIEEKRTIHNFGHGELRNSIRKKRKYVNVCDYESKHSLTSDSNKIVSNHASAGNEDQGSLPTIANFYSMQSLSLLELMERFEENNCLPSAYEAGSRMFMRERLLYQCMTKHNVAGIKTGIDPTFYTNLVSEPYISHADAFELKKEVTSALLSCKVSKQPENVRIQSSDEPDCEINVVDDSDVSKRDSSTEFPMERCRLCGLVLPIVDIASHLKTHHSMDTLNSFEYSQWLLENHKRLQNHLEKLKREAVTGKQSVSCAAAKSQEKKAVRKKTDVGRAAGDSQVTNTQENHDEADTIRKAFTIKKHSLDLQEKTKELNAAKTCVVNDDMRQIQSLDENDSDMNRVNDIGGCGESTQSVGSIQNEPDIKREPDETIELQTMNAVNHTHSSSNQELNQQEPECSKMTESSKRNTNSALRGKLWSQECAHLEQTLGKLSYKDLTSKETPSTTLENPKQKKDTTWTKWKKQQQKQFVPIAPKNESRLDIFETGNMCYACYEKVPPRFSLWSHLLTEHVNWSKMNNKEHFKDPVVGNLNPYYCTHCLKKGSRFSSVRELVEHEWMVHINDFSCYYCGCTFRKYMDMINHFVKEHCILSRCVPCKKDFSASQVYCTSCFHPMAAILHCPYCGIATLSLDELVKHYTVGDFCETPATGETCYSCERKFHDKVALWHHQGPNANNLTVAPKRSFIMNRLKRGPVQSLLSPNSRKAITLKNRVFIYQPSEMISKLNLNVKHFEVCHRIMKELVYRILSIRQKFSLPFDLTSLTTHQRNSLKLFSRTVYFSKLLKDIGIAPLPIDHDVLRMKKQFEALGGKTDLFQFLESSPVRPVGLCPNSVVASILDGKAPIAIAPQSKRSETMQLSGTSKQIVAIGVNQENLNRAVTLNAQTSIAHVTNTNSSSLKGKSNLCPQVIVSEKLKVKPSPVLAPGTTSMQSFHVVNNNAIPTVVLDNQENGSKAVAVNSPVCPGPQSLVQGMSQSVGYIQQPFMISVNQGQFPVCPQVINPVMGFQMAQLPSGQLALVNQPLQPDISPQSQQPDISRQSQQPEVVQLPGDKSIEHVGKKSHNESIPKIKIARLARRNHGLGKNAGARICKKYRKRLARTQFRPSDVKAKFPKSAIFSKAFARELSNYKTIAPMPTHSMGAAYNSMKLLGTELEDARQEIRKSHELQTMARQKSKTISEIANNSLATRREATISETAYNSLPTRREATSKFKRNSEKDFYVKPALLDSLSGERNLRERKGVRRYVFDDSDSDTQTDDTAEDESVTEFEEIDIVSLSPGAACKVENLEKEIKSEIAVKETLINERIPVDISTEEKLDQKSSEIAVKETLINERIPVDISTEEKLDQSSLESCDKIHMCMVENENDSCAQTTSETIYCPSEQESAMQDQNKLLHLHANRLEKYGPSYSREGKIPIPPLPRKQPKPQVFKEPVLIIRAESEEEVKQRIILQKSQEKLNQILDLQKTQIKVHSENSDDGKSTVNHTPSSETRVTATTDHESVMDKCEVKDEETQEFIENHHFHDSKIWRSFVKLERNDHAEKLAIEMKSEALDEVMLSAKFPPLQLKYETRFSSMCASRLIESAAVCGTKSSTNKLKTSDTKQCEYSDESSTDSYSDGYEMCNISESSSVCSEGHDCNDKDLIQTDKLTCGKQASGMALLNTNPRDHLKGNQLRKIGVLNRSKKKFEEKRKIHNFGRGELRNSIRKKRKYDNVCDYQTKHSREVLSNDGTLKMGTSRKRRKLEVDDTMQKFNLDGTEKISLKVKPSSYIKYTGGFSRRRKSFWQARQRSRRSVRKNQLYQTRSSDNAKQASDLERRQSQMQHLLRQSNDSETVTVSGRSESIIGSTSSPGVHGLTTEKFKDGKCSQSDEMDDHCQKQITHDETAELQEVCDPLITDIKCEHSQELNIPLERNISSTGNAQQEQQSVPPSPVPFILHQNLSSVPNLAVNQQLPTLVRNVNLSPSSRASNSKMLNKLNSPKSGLVNIVRYPILLTPKPCGSASFLQAVMKKPEVICPSTMVSMPAQLGMSNPPVVQQSSICSDSLSVMQLSEIYTQSVSKLCPKQAMPVTNTGTSSLVSDSPEITPGLHPGVTNTSPLNTQPATSVALSSSSTAVTSSTYGESERKRGRPKGSVSKKKRNEILLNLPLRITVPDQETLPSLLSKTMPNQETSLSLSSASHVQDSNMTVNCDQKPSPSLLSKSMLNQKTSLSLSSASNIQDSNMTVNCDQKPSLSLLSKSMLNQKTSLSLSSASQSNVTVNSAQQKQRPVLPPSQMPIILSQNPSSVPNRAVIPQGVQLITGQNQPQVSMKSRTQTIQHRNRLQTVVTQQNQLPVSSKGVLIRSSVQYNQRPATLFSSPTSTIQQQNQHQTILFQQSQQTVLQQSQQTVRQIQTVQLNGQTMPGIQLATSQQTVPQMVLTNPQLSTSQNTFPQIVLRPQMATSQQAVPQTILTQPQFAQTAATQQRNQPATPNVQQLIIPPATKIKQEPVDIQSPTPQQAVVPSSFSQSPSFGQLQFVYQQPQVFLAAGQQQLGTPTLQQLGTPQQLATPTLQQLATPALQQLGTPQQLGAPPLQQLQQLNLGIPPFVAQTPQLGYVPVPGSYPPMQTVLSGTGQTFLIQGSIPGSVVTSKPAS